MAAQNLLSSNLAKLECRNYEHDAFFWGITKDYIGVIEVCIGILNYEHDAFFWGDYEGLYGGYRGSL